MQRSFLITGATKGIGLAITHYLNKIGYQVIGIARNKPSFEFPGFLYQANLSDYEETNSVFRVIKQKHHIDGIINNVGVAIPQAIEDVNLKDFNTVIDINLRPAMKCVQTFVSDMKTKKWGRIINITSRAALGKIGRSSYSAAKSGLIGLTRTWALELANYGITVNGVAPGPINTEQFYKDHPKGSDQEKKLYQLFQSAVWANLKKSHMQLLFFLMRKQVLLQVRPYL